MIDRPSALASQLIGRYKINSERAVADAYEILDVLALPDQPDDDTTVLSASQGIRLEVARLLVQPHPLRVRDTTTEVLVGEVLLLAEAIETGHAPAKDSA